MDANKTHKQSTADAPETGVPEATHHEIQRLIEIVATLRGPDGCPWDRAQTLESLKPHLIEEAYELLDVAAGPDADRHCDELGDVLLQILLHCRLREEQGAFALADVARNLADKLVRRHPHVFGEARADTPDDVIQHWEQVKAAERTAAASDAASATPPSVLDGVPRHLPALMKAQRTQGRAARVGFDWDQTADVIAKIDEELAEVREAIARQDPDTVREEIGDLLFSVVNLARFQKIHAEAALDAAVEKFVRRFRAVEARIHAAGRTLDACRLAELDALWDSVKAEERKQGKATP